MSADHSLPPERTKPPGLCSEFVTEKTFLELTISQPDHAALVRKVKDRLRLLRAVVERLPRHFVPYEHIPAYKLTYYLERLSCGHELFVFPQAHSLTARRRHCEKCAQAKLLAADLPPKKPTVSALLLPDQKERTS